MTPQTHPTDSHPSPKERLAVLGENPTDELTTEGETAASLFTDLSSLEEKLTEYETSLIGQYHPNVDREKLNS